MPESSRNAPDRASGSASVTRHAAAEEFLRLCRPGTTPPPGAPETPAAMPLVDVRAPSEFKQGHIPGSVNLPLFDDEQRARVGTLYKEQGREAAILAGYGFIGPRMQSLGQTLLELAKEHGHIAYVCARGGMRSESMAWLGATLGIAGHVLEGGYKSFRRFVLTLLEKPFPLIVLGGKTGSGKTDVLRRMFLHGEQALDLEWLARHRGSAFGYLPEHTQPSTEHFENRLALSLFHCEPGRPIWVEDECENLGSANLPRAFFRLLRASPLVLLESSREARLVRVLREYGSIPPESIALSLDRIKKRLGGLAHKQALESLAAGKLEGVAEILLDYYDRAYEKQIRDRDLIGRVAEDNPDLAAPRLIETARPRS